MGSDKPEQMYWRGITDAQNLTQKTMDLIYDLNDISSLQKLNKTFESLISYSSSDLVRTIDVPGISNQKFQPNFISEFGSNTTKNSYLFYVYQHYLFLTQNSVEINDINKSIINDIYYLNKTLNTTLNALDDFNNVKDTFDEVFLKKSDGYINFTKNCAIAFQIFIFLALALFGSINICLIVFIFVKFMLQEVILLILFSFLEGVSIALFILTIIFGVLAKASNDYIAIVEYVSTTSNLESKTPLYFNEKTAKVLNTCINSDGNLLGNLTNSTTLPVSLIINFYTQVSDITTYLNNYLQKEDQENLKKIENHLNNFIKYSEDIFNYEPKGQSMFTTALSELNKFTDSTLDTTYQKSGSLKTDQWVAHKGHCTGNYIYYYKDTAPKSGKCCFVILEWTVDEFVQRYKNTNFNYPEYLNKKSIEVVFNNHSEILTNYSDKRKSILNYIIQKDKEIKAELQKVDSAIKNTGIKVKKFREGFVGLKEDEKLEMDEKFQKLNCSNIESYLDLFDWRLEREYRSNVNTIYLLSIVPTFLSLILQFGYSFMFYSPFSCVKKKTALAKLPQPNTTTEKYTRDDSIFPLYMKVNFKSKIILKNRVVIEKKNPV